MSASVRVCEGDEVSECEGERVGVCVRATK